MGATEATTALFDFEMPNGASHEHASEAARARLDERWIDPETVVDVHVFQKLDADDDA